MKKFLGTIMAAAVCMTSAAQAFPVSAAENSKIGTVMISGWSSCFWTADEWKQNIASAKSAGFDSVIIDAVLIISRQFANGFVQGALKPNCYCLFPTEVYDEYEFSYRGDMLKTVLEAAKAEDMTVWLGTVRDTGCAYSAWQEPEYYFGESLQKSADLSADLMEEIWERYGQEYDSQIAGWYFSNEILNNKYSCDGSDNGEYARIISQNIKTSVSAIERLCPEKPLMISSSYMIDTSTPQQYGDFISDIIDSAGVRTTDIFAAGDGSGSDYFDEYIRSWVEAEKEAVSGKMRFWVRNSCSNSDHSSKMTGKMQECYGITADLSESNIISSWFDSYASDAELNRQFTEFNTGRITGDVNADGKFNVADMVMLQKWLLADGGVQIASWQAADLCRDGRLDALDLCLMRKLLVGTDKGNEIIVSNVSELYEAVENVKPGDVIKIAPGTYDCSEKCIESEVSGTSALPIVLEALDNDAPPVLKGKAAEEGAILHILGDFWTVSGLEFTNARNGIILENSHHTTVQCCKVHDVGAEGIAIHSESLYCEVRSCDIHDTGLTEPEYGDGIYMGFMRAANSNFICNHNVIADCTFSNTAAESITLEEYTTDNEICGCRFNGDGMTEGACFIEINGNMCSVHDNVGYRNGNDSITSAFRVNVNERGWGHHNIFKNNSLYMDQPCTSDDPSRRIYVVDSESGDFSVKNNLVDYGEGLAADSEDCYNSPNVSYLD